VKIKSERGRGDPAITRAGLISEIAEKGQDGDSSQVRLAKKKRAQNRRSKGEEQSTRVARKKP